MENTEAENISMQEAKVYSTLNLGLTHPATHGIFQNVLKMDGEVLIDAVSTIGYIHRAFERNWTEKAWEKLDSLIKDFPKALKEFENLLNRNRIFMDRTIGCGGIKAERALEYGFTGPNLRAAGVDYDVRVMNPYSSYED